MDMWENDVACAVEYCRDNALSGGAGKRIAELMGISLEEFLRFGRINLNSQFPGRRGKTMKGDLFDKLEGIQTANALLRNGAAERFILLGRSVAESFCFDYNPLAVKVRLNFLFLLVPNPSSVNLFYNDARNRIATRKALTEFCK